MTTGNNSLASLDTPRGGAYFGPLENAGIRQILCFTLQGRSFAMKLGAIREIIKYREPTPVPMAPAAVKGIINLRGTAVPVVDLSLRFGQAPTRAGRRTCLVILEVEMETPETGPAPQAVGVIVDEVDEVLDLPDADIEPPPPFGARLRTDFIAGMARIREDFVILLNVPRVLALNDSPASAAAGENLALSALPLLLPPSIPA